MLQTRTLSGFTGSLISRSARPQNYITSSFTATQLRKMSASKMGERLKGKTIVITGASSGIGRATALEFAKTSPNDLRLVLTARRLDTLKQVAEEIKTEVGEGVKVLPFKLDVSQPDEVRSFVSNLPEEFREIDVLVNNAGLVKGVAQAPEIKEEDINIMYATNVTGLINMTQAVLQIYKKRDEGGRGDIINIGSIAGREPYAGGSIYCSTKAAVKSFTDALRKELVATRIRVMNVDPGQVETNFSVIRYYGDKAKADAVYAGCDPLTPEDIAEVIVFNAGRRENVVVADTLVYPSHQAGAGVLHRKPVSQQSSDSSSSSSIQSKTDSSRPCESQAQPPPFGQKPKEAPRSQSQTQESTSDTAASRPQTEDPFSLPQTRPYPDFAPPGFEDEHRALRHPHLSGYGGRGQGSPFGIGGDDLNPPGMGPHDPLRPSFTPGGTAGGFGGMHPTFDDPLFAGRRGQGGQGFDPQVPDGARYDPVGPGEGPRDHMRGGRGGFPGGGAQGGFGGFGGRGGQGGPGNPFGGGGFL